MKPGKLRISPSDTPSSMAGLGGGRLVSKRARRCAWSAWSALLVTGIVIRRGMRGNPWPELAALLELELGALAVLQFSSSITCIKRVDINIRIYSASLRSCYLHGAVWSGSACISVPTERRKAAACETYSTISQYCC